MDITPEEYVKNYLPYAKAAAAKKGFHWQIPLTAGAQESAYGKKAVGNNFFGIKDTDGINGNEQLMTTTEYHSTMNVKYPVNISTVKVGLKRYKYKVKDWFRKYSSAELSFLDYLTFFETNPRYKEALKYKMDPDRFFEEIQAAGYATDPNYASNLKAVRQGVLKRLPK